MSNTFLKSQFSLENFYGVIELFIASFWIQVYLGYFILTSPNLVLRKWLDSKFRLAFYRQYAWGFILLLLSLGIWLITPSHPDVLWNCEDFFSCSHITNELEFSRRIYVPSNITKLSDFFGIFYSTFLTYFELCRFLVTKTWDFESHEEIFVLPLKTEVSFFLIRNNRLRDIIKITYITILWSWQMSKRNELAHNAFCIVKMLYFSPTLFCYNFITDYLLCENEVDSFKFWWIPAMQFFSSRIRRALSKLSW